ncbi:MAG: GDP-mannose 4,6-dehydratase [Kiritimatiellae bacterium]|nr:GDP-mannose 4,6-dehydratase [Kiritimatiellia bacterium]
MKVLVTGGAGFVARYLCAELTSAGHEVVLSDVIGLDAPNFIKADLSNSAEILDLVDSTRPDAIVHLGAISFVPDAERSLEKLRRVNLGGTEALLEAVRQSVPKAKFVFASTAMVLGSVLTPYAAMKLAAEGAVALFALEGHSAVIVRPGNHTGPGQSERFVVPAFVRQALDIKAGLRDCFAVGNLDSVRDFTDVRDVVRAYRILLESEDAKGAYGVCSGCRMSMGQMLELVAKAIGVSHAFKVDERLWRPTDVAQAVDTSRIAALGWRPEVPIEETIREMAATFGRPTAEMP